MRSDLVQAGESDPKVMSILEEGEVARDPVKVNPNSCCNIFPERLDVGLVPAGVPEQPLVAQTPRTLLLSKHVDKSIHVQPEQRISSDQSKPQMENWHLARRVPMPNIMLVPKIR